MKFAQYLKAVEVEAPDELQGRFLNYKSLKKTLKRCNQAAHAAAGSAPSASAAGKPPPPGHVPGALRDGFVCQLEAEVNVVNSTFEQVANSVLADFRRCPAAGRIAKQADAVTAAAARSLPPAAAEPWEGDDDGGPSTSTESSYGGRRRFALKLVRWGDTSSHDHTAGGRYGGKRRNSLEDEAGAISYAALHRAAGHPRSQPPWWAGMGKALAGKVRAMQAARAEAAAAEAKASRARGVAPPPPPGPRTALGRWLATRRAEAASRSLTSTRAIAARAAWARRYARANTVGLRKIVKKYGKMCGDPDAGSLLQAFWAGDAKAKTGFLTSPLVAELRVVEVLLSHDRAVTLGNARSGGVGNTLVDAPPAEQACAQGVAPAEELAAPAPPHPLLSMPAGFSLGALSSPPAPPPLPPSEADVAAAAEAAARRAAKGKAPLILPPVDSGPPSEGDSDDDTDDGGGRGRGPRPRPTSAQHVRGVSARSALSGRRALLSAPPPPLASIWAEPPGGTTSASAAAAIERGVGVVPFCPDEALFEDDDDDEDEEEEEEEEDGEAYGDPEGATVKGAWYMGGWAAAARSGATSTAGKSPPRGLPSPTMALGALSNLISPPASSAASGSRQARAAAAAATAAKHARSSDAAALDEVLDADAVPSARALSGGDSSAASTAVVVAGGGLGSLAPTNPAALTSPASVVSAVTAAAVRPIAPHLRCPICLDALFRPLGLGCGHCFCTDCALAAVGQGNAVGTLRARLSALDRSAPCPGCRRPGAFVGAVPMLHTSSLVRLRHPKAWAERKAEALARARQQRRALDRRAARQAKKWKGLGVTPFDILRVPDTEMF